MYGAKFHSLNGGNTLGQETLNHASNIYCATAEDTENEHKMWEYLDRET
jgi:hypothetical protein